jgi:hypothetical protein
MLPRQNPAQDQDTSKNDYSLHDLELQTYNLPPHQDTRKITARGKENRASSTKDTHEEEGKTTRKAALSV